MRCRGWCEVLRKSLLELGKGTFLEQFAKLPHHARILLSDAFVPKENPADAKATGTFFFNRSAGIFDNILDYYRSGQLHCPIDACPQRFLQVRLPLSPRGWDEMGGDGMKYVCRSSSSGSWRCGR